MRDAPTKPFHPQEQIKEKRTDFPGPNAVSAYLEIEPNRDQCFRA